MSRQEKAENTLLWFGAVGLLFAIASAATGLLGIIYSIVFGGLTVLCGAGAGIATIIAEDEKYLR